MRLRSRTSAEQLYDLLADGHHLTKNEACTRLGLTSKRQIQRIVKSLREEGIPVQDQYDGGRKVYFLAPEDQRPEGGPLDLTDREMLALAVAAQSARSALRPTPLIDPLTRAAEALIDAIAAGAVTFEPEREAMHWHFSDAPSADLDPQVFQTLRRAVVARRSVRIDYVTASSGRRWSGRKIDPLQIAVIGGSWLCVAYCHERQGLRDFSIAGMEAAWTCDPEEEVANFTVPDGFDPELHFKGRFRAVDDAQSYVVRLLVEPDWTEYFRRKQYHPSQQIEEAPADRPDGRMLVSYDVRGLDEISAWIRSWGPKVKVLAPEALAARVAKEARQTAARYATD